MSSTTICKKCSEPEDKQNRPGLLCTGCTSFIHVSCLDRLGTPGDLAGDVFFDYLCSGCSTSNEEDFKRNKFPWAHVIYLTLYHLNINSHQISKRGFFHYKTHVCFFIDSYWDVLFGPKFKQKKNWVGTIAGILSVYNTIMFKSGLSSLGESGWWKLQHSFSPAVAAYILQEIARDKVNPILKSRSKNHGMIMDIEAFYTKVTELGFGELLLKDQIQTESDTEDTPCKKMRLESDDQYYYPEMHTGAEDNEESGNETINDNSIQGRSQTQYSISETTSETNYAYAEDVIVKQEPITYTEETFDYPVEYTQQLESYIPQSDVSSNYSGPQSPTYTQTHIQIVSQTDAEDSEDTKAGIKIKNVFSYAPEEYEFKEDSLFSSEPNSNTMPWLEKEDVKPNVDLVEMNDYEEIQLLRQVDSMILSASGEKLFELRRLKAKLSLRRLKRKKRLPVFNLDYTVKVLGGYVTEDPKIVSSAERIYDRFQKTYLQDNLSGTVPSPQLGPMTVSQIVPAPFRSPYSSLLLKPFIRRDRESTPLWLQLMDELLLKTNRHNKDYVLPKHASIDYSYVRPQHIAIVNNLCAQHFWPGIDLTETLQYPEFSCVVTYRALVVGCSFLVPGPLGYVSFVVTRHGWRRAGIATFMLYHLLQTCSGKDVTLHVSPTNPAVFLYQKFGFKVEELIQDFYEKYYDAEHKGCRHALFLRLVR